MAVSLALHALAAVVWVGGMFFAYVALRPAAGALAPGERLPLWRRTFARFFVAVWVSVVLLLATGYLMIFAYLGGFGGAGIHVHVMHLIGIVMILLFLHLYFAPWRRLRRRLDGEDLEGAAAELDRIRRIVAVNLALGLITVAIGSSGPTPILPVSPAPRRKFKRLREEFVRAEPEGEVVADRHHDDFVHAVAPGDVLEPAPHPVRGAGDGPLARLRDDAPLDLGIKIGCGLLGRGDRAGIARPQAEDEEVAGHGEALRLRVALGAYDEHGDAPLWLVAQRRRVEVVAVGLHYEVAAAAVDEMGE